MAVKHYAQIDFDLFSDPKFRKLSSNDVRFIYLTAHCSKLSNYLGLFRYPVEIWSYDANVKPVEVQAAILTVRFTFLWAKQVSKLCHETLVRLAFVPLNLKSLALICSVPHALWFGRYSVCRCRVRRPARCVACLRASKACRGALLIDCHNLQPCAGVRKISNGVGTQVHCKILGWVKPVPNRWPH